MDILRKFLLSFVFVLPIVCYAGEAVDINAADQEALMTIKGIGEKRAEAIIAYRAQHGRFRSVDDLVYVPGVSESLVEKSRTSLVVKPSK